MLEGKMHVSPGFGLDERVGLATDIWSQPIETAWSTANCYSTEWIEVQPAATPGRLKLRSTGSEPSIDLLQDARRRRTAVEALSEWLRPIERRGPAPPPNRPPGAQFSEIGV